MTHLAYSSGDANWVWKVDVAASLDGDAIRACCPRHRNVDILRSGAAGRCRRLVAGAGEYLRLRHYDGRRHDVIRMRRGGPVYDGVADETWDVPATGRTISSTTHTVDDAAPLVRGRRARRRHAAADRRFYLLAGEAAGADGT